MAARQQEAHTGGAGGEEEPEGEEEPAIEGGREVEEAAEVMERDEAREEVLEDGAGDGEDKVEHKVELLNMAGRLKDVSRMDIDIISTGEMMFQLDKAMQEHDNPLRQELPPASSHPPPSSHSTLSPLSPPPPPPGPPPRSPAPPRPSTPSPTGRSGSRWGLGTSGHLGLLWLGLGLARDWGLGCLVATSGEGELQVLAAVNAGAVVVGPGGPGEDGARETISSTVGLLHNKVDKKVRLMVETSENQKKVNKVWRLTNRI